MRVPRVPAISRRIDQFKSLSPAKKKNSICIASAVLIGLAIGITAWINHRPAADKRYDKTLPATSALESHVLFGGDVYWGRRMHDWSQQSSLKEKYPFSKLHTLQPEIYDAWVINLECPAVPGVKQPIGFVPQLWQFNCDTDYLPEAAKWFDIVSLANNHTANQKREAGLAATRKELDKHGIQHFSGFNPHKTSADGCDVVAVPARVRLHGKQQAMQLPVAMCGYHGVYFTITDRAVQAMQRYAKVMPVISYPHMGTEYQASSDEKRRAVYRSMIDNGADVVFGNHPHWVQDTEVYKKHLIVYSMGNFIFDQQFSQEVMRSAAMDVVLKVKAGAVDDKQLEAWAALGKQCGAPDDNCLQEAEKQGLRRLPIQFGYDVVGVDISKQVTHRADNRVLQGILERLKWPEVQKQGTRDTNTGHTYLQ